MTSNLIVVELCALNPAVAQTSDRGSEQTGLSTTFGPDYVPRVALDGIVIGMFLDLWEFVPLPLDSRYPAYVDTEPFRLLSGGY